MKNFILALILGIPFYSLGQTSVTADPALQNAVFTNLSNGVILPFGLPLNGPIKLKLPLRNINTNSAIPAGSCKVKIGLGSKMVVSPTFNLVTANTSNKFLWTVTNTGGQFQLSGDLIDELPAGYSDTAIFELAGSILGNSTITINFLVTNHNTGIVLSDEDPTNNGTSSLYSVIAAILPVKLTNLYTVKDNCSLQLFFNTENEYNVEKYELQMAKLNDNSFSTVETLPASNSRSYHFNSQDFTTSLDNKIVQLRIKVLDYDGRFYYSDVLTSRVGCKSESDQLILYPNPISSSTNEVQVENKINSFEGVYNISIFDVAGKAVMTNSITVNNNTRFKVNLQQLPAGQYVLRFISKETGTVESIKFIKL